MMMLMQAATMRMVVVVAIAENRSPRWSCTDFTPEDQ